MVEKCKTVHRQMLMYLITYCIDCGTWRGGGRTFLRAFERKKIIQRNFYEDFERCAKKVL
jgi:hypothetical protein